MKEFYSVRSLAPLLKVSPQTVRRMVRRKQLRAHKIGYLIRFRRRDVEAFLKRCRPNKKQRAIAHKNANRHVSKSQRKTRNAIMSL